jgi:hypothetical protein
MILHRVQGPQQTVIFMNISITIEPKIYPAPFAQTLSDESFISKNSLDISTPEGAYKYLIHRFEKIANINDKAAFDKKCLESRLDRRTTEYQLVTKDKLKETNLILGVSGAGSMHLHLLSSRENSPLVGASSSKLWILLCCQVFG